MSAGEAKPAGAARGEEPRKTELTQLVLGTAKSMAQVGAMLGLRPTDIPFAAMKVCAWTFAHCFRPEADAQGVAMLQRQFAETVAALRADMERDGATLQ